MYFKQFYLGCLAHASYLIGSQGKAVVVGLHLSHMQTSCSTSQVTTRIIATSNSILHYVSAADRQTHN